MNDPLIRFNESIVEGIILFRMGRDQIVDSKKQGDQAICRRPRDCNFIAICWNKLLLDLLLKALYNVSKRR